jgi:hypothetical protein
MNDDETTKVEVTTRLRKCLEYVKEAIKDLPPGERKQLAAAALDYMDKAFKNEPEPELEWPCRPGILLIP